MGRAYSEAGLRSGLVQQCWLTSSSQPEKLATFSEHVHVHRSAEDMMNCNRWNAVISAVPTNNQYQTAKSFRKETRPYIAEKPFFNSEQALTIDQDSLPLNFFVAYNRRFFPSVEALKSIFLDQIPVYGRFFLSQQELEIKGVPSFLEDGIHILDLIRHLAGPFELRTLNLLKWSEESSIYCYEVKSASPQVLSLEVGLGITGNHGFSGHQGSKTFEMRPTEVLSIYDGMERSYIDSQTTSRYTPILIEELNSYEDSVKPGITSLLEEVMIGNDFSRLERLEAARETAAIAMRIQNDIETSF